MVQRIAFPAAVLSAAFFVTSTILMGLGKAAALNQYADRATHLEILWRSTHGLGLTSLMSESFFTGSHWFAAHFTPLLFVAYWPFFRVFPGQEVLVALQTAYLAITAFPLYAYAKKILGPQSSALLICSFFFYPTLHYIAIYGTAYLELAIPTLAGALWALEDDRPWLFIFFAFIACLVREEVALVVSTLGLFAILRGHRKTGSFVALLGAIYFLVALKFIIPSFRSNTSLVYMRNYSSWGDSPGAILTAVFGHPFVTILKLCSLPRLGNVAMYLLPLACFPLLDPLLLLVALPNIATTFLSDSVTNYNFTLYYLSPTIPVLFFAAVRAIARLEKRHPNSKLPAAGTIAAASLASAIFFGPSPIGRQFWDRSYRVGIFRTTDYHRTQYVPSAAAETAREMASHVPITAQVSAPQHLLPMLFDRKRMLVFPEIDNGIDHVIIDRSRSDVAGWADSYDRFRENPEEYYAKIENNSAWIHIRTANNVRIFRRAP